MTVLSDSVLLGAKQALVQEMGAAGWKVDYVGHPAIMIQQIDQELQRAGRRVGSVVVIGVGYNSLWEKGRVHYDRWAKKFDREADHLLATLHSLGAKEIVWVNLREPSPSVIPKAGLQQYRAYAWYFPYVNERLRQLRQRHPGLIVADWAAISNRAGITYDAIHLNSKGVRLMINLIRASAGV
jgi:hypothetical protein